MLTRSHFQQACTHQSPPITEIKKGSVVVIGDVRQIVMARLQSDGEYPVSYSICNLSDLKGATHGIFLDKAKLIDPQDLSPDERRKASYFV